MNKEISNGTPNDLKEALSMLDQAAGQSSGDLGKLIKQEVEQIRNAIGNVFESVPEELEKKTELTKDWFVKTSKKAKQLSKDAGQSIDKSAHSNPWYFVAGAVAATGLVSYLLTRRGESQ